MTVASGPQALPQGSGLGQAGPAQASTGQAPTPGPSQGRPPGQHPGGPLRASALRQATVLGAEAAARLRFWAHELAPSELPDLLAAASAPGRRLFWRHDTCLLGVGEALRLPLSPAWASPASTAGVREVLSRLRPVRASAAPPWPAAVPTALGALPYDPSQGGYLCVPKMLVGRRGKLAWATLVAEDEGSLGVEALREQLRELTPPPGTQPGPDRFILEPSMPHEQWKQLVALSVAEIQAGGLAKVVLARRVEVSANRPFLLGQALSRLVSLYPTCTVFRVEGFIGASPEVLVSKAGLGVSSHPLAGTVARSGDEAADASLLGTLLRSAKHRQEHRLVVEAIAARLGPLCSRLDVPAEPSVVALRNVSHLATDLRGTLKGPGPLPSALELAAVLQPTPAVGGAPVDRALSWQLAHEGFDRGFYAGPVGWVDARGDGEWVLGLRSAEVNGPKASLYAGSGIVAGSDPDAELAETQLKLQALLAALVRP